MTSNDVAHWLDEYQINIHVLDVYRKSRIKQINQFPPGRRTGQQPGWLRCETSGSNQGGQVEWISKKEGQVRGIESKLYLFCSSQMSRTDLHQPQRVEGRRRGQRRSIRQGWLNILMVVLGHCWGSSYLAISSGWGAGLCQGLIQVFLLQRFLWNIFPAYS